MQGLWVRPQVGNYDPTCCTEWLKKIFLKSQKTSDPRLSFAISLISEVHPPSQALKAEELCFLPSGHWKQESLPGIPCSQAVSLTYGWWQAGQEECAKQVCTGVEFKLDLISFQGPWRLLLTLSSFINNLQLLLVSSTQFSSKSNYSLYSATIPMAH